MNGNIDGWRLNADIFLECDSTVYFTIWEMNLIGCFDLNQNSISLINGPSEEDFFGTRLYAGLNYWGGYLILTPCYAKYMWKYDIKNSTWTKIDISEYVSLSMTCKFACAVINNDKIFLFGHNYKNVIIIDLKEEKVTKVIPLAGNACPSNVLLFANNYVYTNGKVYIVNHCSNDLYVFDTASMYGEWKKIGDGQYQCIGVQYYDGKFWFWPYCSKNGFIVIGDDEGNENYAYGLTEDYDQYFIGGYIIDGQIILYDYSPESLVFDIYTKRAKRDSVGVSGTFRFTNEKWIICKIDGKIKVINNNGRSEHETEIILNDTVLDEYRSNYSNTNNTVLQENRVYGLEMLMSII